MRSQLLERSFLLQGPLLARLDKASRALLLSEGGRAFDFGHPKGEPALSAPDSVSWRIFKNPVSLFIGGVAAVILELAEPRVRTGVWEHSGFRSDPGRRLRRTGLAAMVTVYGPRSAAAAMIAGIRQMHERVRGITPAGEPYAASDPELLNWVHATAAFGFLEAYHTYVARLTDDERDRYYREGTVVAQLYGATDTAASEAEMRALLEAKLGRLEPSPIIFEFLEIMRRTSIFSRILRPAQPLLVRAAIALVPANIRTVLGLDAHSQGREWEKMLIRRAGALADRVVLESSPAVQACLRLGLPRHFLYGARQFSS